MQQKKSTSINVPLQKLKLVNTIISLIHNYADTSFFLIESWIVKNSQYANVLYHDFGRRLKL